MIPPIQANLSAKRLTEFIDNGAVGAVDWEIADNQHRIMLRFDDNDFSSNLDCCMIKFRARLSIAKKIQDRMIDQLFEELDAELPDVEMSSQEIQDEINAYRNEKKQKA